MAKYLVTGGSGFLGTLLVERLLADGHDVASIDLLPATVKHPHLNAIIGDIRHAAVLDGLFAASRPDAVFHCAALLAHGGVNEREMWSANVDGTRNLAKAAMRAGVDQMVYLSSNCLWGTGFDRPVTENDIPLPCERYGLSKWEGERILSEYSDHFATSIIRCPTIIDEGRLGLLAILFEFIADGKRVWMVGKGDNRYQFIYAADLIEAMRLAADCKIAGVFGIGSDNVGTMKESFDHVIAMAGSHARTVALPRMPAIAAMQLAHHLRISPLGPYHYRMIASSFVFDTTAIKAALDWQPTLSNADMLWRAYRFYQTNRAEIAARNDVSAHRQAAKMGVIRVLKWLS
ncbi:MAG: NAD-dependent epimerase [Rhizorhabdus sp.]|nr:NAD-dependent epimerase [Rhizorhabdus sp.]